MKLTYTPPTIRRIDLAEDFRKLELGFRRNGDFDAADRWRQLADAVESRTMVMLPRAGNEHA